MPRRPTFALDCDGLLADFNKSTFQIIEDLTGIRYTPADFSEWNYFRDSRINPHASAIWDRIKEEGRCLNYSVLPGVREGLSRLREVANLFVCTSVVKSRNYVPERIVWLERMGFDFKTEIVFTYNKRLICADVLVDDEPKNVDFFKAVHPDKVAVLWRTPGDTRDYFPVTEGVEKADDWDTLVALARRLTC